MIDNRQRAMMAADMCERAARALREDRYLDAWRMISLASTMHHSGTPEDDYRAALWTGVVEDVSRYAAAASIQRGKEPDDSLAGQVREMRRRVENEMPGALSAEERREFVGARNAFTAVLALLGVKP